MKTAKDAFIVINVPTAPEEMRPIADAIGGPVDYGTPYLVLDWDDELADKLGELDAEISFFPPIEDDA